MKEATLEDLQESVQDKSAFSTLEDYFTISLEFLNFVEKSCPTRIISPSQPNYIFYQYGKDYKNKITRPLNIDLFIESVGNFKTAFERYKSFLVDLSHHREATVNRKGSSKYIESKEINKVIYWTAPLE